MMERQKTTVFAIGGNARKTAGIMKYMAMSGIFLSVLFCLLSAPVQANPQGGQVISGQATITQVPNYTEIKQTSNQAILHWDSFNINNGEHTQFIQPSADAIALNRILNGDISKIYGRLSANGKIMLLNPAGIIFGPNSKIDVAGLVATTADIKNDDFMNGRLHFTSSEDSPNAVIINQGEMTFKDGGLVALVAPSVQNDGVITVRLGRVHLGSGKEFTVDLFGDQLINFTVGSEITNPIVGLDGNILSDAVSNSGEIYADGGSVTLSAQVAENIVDNAINMSGLIRSATILEHTGEIILTGGDQGLVLISGVMRASC